METATTVLIREDQANLGELKDYCTRFELLKLSLFLNLGIHFSYSNIFKNSVSGNLHF